MNEDNLKGHGFHERTAEEQRALARSGGIASGKVRRERRTIAMALREVLEQPGKDGSKSTRLDGIVAAAIQRLYKNPNMKDLKTLAEILGELKITVDSSGMILNINSSKEGAENINALLQGTPTPTPTQEEE